MNELITFIRRLVLGLIALAAGLFVFLLALVVGLVFVIVTLLRGRRPSWQNVQFRRYGGMGQRKPSAASPADVVDVEAREVKDPSGPHQRLDDNSSKISP